MTDGREGGWTLVSDPQAIDRAAKYLRNTLQGGKVLTPWEQTPAATKRKWVALATGTLVSAAPPTPGDPA